MAASNDLEFVQTHRCFKIICIRLGQKETNRFVLDAVFGCLLSQRLQLRRYMADPKHVEIDIHFTSREHDMRRVVDGRGQSTCCMKRVRKVEAELPAVSVFNGCGEIYAVRRMSEVALNNAAWLSYKVMIRTADRQGFRLTGKADDRIDIRVFFRNPLNFDWTVRRCNKDGDAGLFSHRKNTSVSMFRNPRKIGESVSKRSCMRPDRGAGNATFSVGRPSGQMNSEPGRAS